MCCERESGSASFIAHAFDETGYVDNGSSDGAAADFLGAVMGANAHDIKAAINGFEMRLGMNLDTDSASGAVLDVDRDADGDFPFVAKRLQGMEAGGFHEPNHVGR
jgi:hypothetical protein